MIRKTFTAIALLVSFCAFGETSGNYLTWLGFGSMNNAQANYSVFLGGLSGANSWDCDYGSYVGVMSGGGSYYLKSCNAIGYWSFYGASECNYTLGFGPHACQSAYGLDNSIFIGKNAGNYANYANGVIAIGMNAGRELNDCEDCVFIGNGSGQGVDGGFGIVDLNGRIVLADGDLSLAADNIVLQADRSAFHYSDADVYMSDGYGSDTNTGRSTSSPVRTIGRAVAVVNALVAAGTIPTNVPPVVVADCGRYESASFSVTDKLNPRRIVFKSACGKRATFLVPHYNGNTNNGDPEMDPLNCQDGNVEFHDFTMTRFDGVSDSEVDGGHCKATVNIRVKFVNCDICRNRPSVNYSFLACQMENCDIYDNYFRSYNGYAAMNVFGHAWDGHRTTMKNCRIFRNNFVSSRLFHYMDKVENCLIVNSHFFSTTTTFTNCTIIADHFKSTHISGQSNNGASAMVGRNFIVCPDFNYCSTADPYRTNDNCVCVASANLTMDYIAADENCPSVCDNGLPDFGYRTSMFGYYKSLRRIAAQVRNIAPDSVAIDKADGTGRVVIRNSNGSLRVSEVTVTPDEPEDEDDEGGNAPLLMSAPPQGNADDGGDDNTPHLVI